jgi:hypothetical protein
MTVIKNWYIWSKRKEIVVKEFVHIYNKSLSLKTKTNNKSTVTSTAVNPTNW